MNNIAETLQLTFCNNFVGYYTTHQAHANVTGRNFYSDHKLLQKIYEDLQDQIDTLGEFLRAMDEPMPTSLTDILATSTIEDGLSFGESHLKDIKFILEELVDTYVKLEGVTKNTPEHMDLNNYAQDQIRTLHKFIWMLRSTLE
jgi:starvation-inducible DNA-binding protein